MTNLHLTDVECVGRDSMKDRAAVEIGKAATQTALY